MIYFFHHQSSLLLLAFTAINSRIFLIDNREFSFAGDLDVRDGNQAAGRCDLEGGGVHAVLTLRDTRKVRNIIVAIRRIVDVQRVAVDGDSAAASRRLDAQ